MQISTNNWTRLFNLEVERTAEFFAKEAKFALYDKERKQ